MRPFLADLHVHSVLSACADDLMLPGEVITTAGERGLAIIGVVDHNSTENAAAFVAAGRRAEVTVIPGMEVTTREEVHVLALFPAVDLARAWQQEVYRHLPDLTNNERLFGTQLIVDASGNLLRLDDRLLSTATDLSLAQVLAGVRAMDGLAIPAHVDRTAFGLLGQLGFVPPDLTIDVVEVSPRVIPDRAAELYPSLAGRAIIQSSDAHRLAEVGVKCTVFWLKEPTFAEIDLACHRRAGRRISFPPG